MTMCEQHQFIRTSVNICSLYILFVTISINYVFVESKLISVNTTEPYDEDSSDENYKLTPNYTEPRVPNKDTKSNLSVFQSTQKLKKTDQRSRPRPKIAASSTAAVQDISTAVWCFCNTASCVPNGYMCKSAIGACYSKSIERVVQTQQPSHISSSYYDASSNFLIRGCVEFLPKRERRKCVMKLDPLGDSEKKLSMLNASEKLRKTEGNADINKELAINNAEEDDSDLQCCNEDVCNYEVSQPVFVVRKSDDSQSSALNNKFELFRSATIAVSVAGLIILIILMIFAGRMLASDAKSFAYRHQVSRDLGSKAPYYVERTLASSESGSILCAKSLQKNDRTTFCGLPLTKSTDCRSTVPSKSRCSFAKPISAICSCSTIDTTSHLSSVTRTYDFDFIEPLTTDNINSNHFLLDTSFPT